MLSEKFIKDTVYRILSQSAEIYRR